MIHLPTNTSEEPCIYVGRPSKAVLQQRQSNGFARIVALLSGEHDLVRQDRIVQVTVRLNIPLNTVDEVVNLTLKRMMGHITGIGRDRRQLYPVVLARKQM
jgi:hypothetical protein